MDKSQSSKFSKLVKGLKETLTRQKNVGKDRGAIPSGHPVTIPPEYDRCTRDRIPLPPPPVSDAISQLPYYHPHLTSKDDLTNFMSQYSLQEGYFLLRRSFKDPNSFTITVNHQCGLKHISVIMNNDRFSLKDRDFYTIDEMVQFYSHNEIPNEEDISGILLRFPIRRPAVEFGEYIIVSKEETPAETPSPYLSPKEEQGSEGDRHQSPDPRPPVALPRGVGKTSNPTTPRKGSLIDQNIPPSVDRPSQDVVGAAPPFRDGYVGSQKSSIGLPIIGTPSDNDPDRSTNLTTSSNSIDPPSKNDPNLAMPSHRPGLTDAPWDASQDERCDCGLLMREASLPLGWSIHVSQDPDTKDQPFFLSPNNETNWDLPLLVALSLSPEQQDLIRNLRFGSDFKASGPHPVTSPRGCSPKTKCFGPATPAKTIWFNCDDYESLRDVHEQPEKSTDGVQGKISESSELARTVICNTENERAKKGGRANLKKLTTALQ